MKVLFNLLLITSTVIILKASEPLSTKTLQKQFIIHRCNMEKDSKLLRINPDGGIISRKPHGAGIYSFEFAVDESNPKFQYHVPVFFIGFNPTVSELKKIRMGKVKNHEFIELKWLKSGRILVNWVKTDGSIEKLGDWIKPGPSPESALVKDKIYKLNLLITGLPGEMKVFLNKDISDDPDCEFTIEHGSPGLFGVINAKWYSLIKLKSLKFTKLKD